MISLFKNIGRFLYTEFMRLRFSNFGKGSYVSPFGSYINPHKIIIGNNVYIGPRAILSASEGLFIGEGVVIGPELIVMGGDHGYQEVGKRIHENKTGVNKFVKIEDDVWIGARVVILKGIVVGEGSIVGAGSVVTRNILPYSIYAGNPARFIKPRFSKKEDLKQHLKLVNSRYCFEDLESKLYDTL